MTAVGLDFDRRLVAGFIVSALSLLMRTGIQMTAYKSNSFGELACCAFINIRTGGSGE